MIRARHVLALVLLAGACGCAGAHSPDPNANLFYSGMLHPLRVPAHVMAIVVMGLWLAQRWPADTRPLAAFMGALCVGLVGGRFVSPLQVELVVLASTAVGGVAVAAGRALPPALLIGAAALLGGLLGLDSQPDGVSGWRLWLALAGTWLAMLLGLSAMLVLSELAARSWMKIGLRVVASWVAAAAILVLALSWFAPRPAPPAAASTTGAVVR